MHIYFSGIGGAGIGPLALVAKQAGFTVSGSDKQDSDYISYLRDHDVSEIHIGQDNAAIAAAHANRPIDWFVHTSALSIENPDHPEIAFCRENNIRVSKRDELLNQILSDKQLKLIAVAGTHGKTTTTAMTVWLMQQLGIPISYLLPAKTSFAEMGAYTEGSEYFVYECDEYDRNFLAFSPFLSLITGMDYDHPDIYPTLDDYNQAFRTFLGQTQHSVLWRPDAEKLNVTSSETTHILDYDESLGVMLPGLVNRQDGALVGQGLALLLQADLAELVAHINKFPGVSRRFEQIVPGLFTDYAHTPPKIRGALQLGHEVAGSNLVVVYEGLHNTRQHFIKDELPELFDSVKQLYIAPSYLAREDTSLELLTPEKLVELLSPTTQAKTSPVQLDDTLHTIIQTHLATGDTVLCLSAGGGGSLDEWLRAQFT